MVETNATQKIEETKSSDRMSLIIFSGTIDKLLSAGVLASGGVAMDMDVEIFLTMWGLNAFRKGMVESNTKMSSDFAEMAPMMMSLMQKKNVPSWYETLKKAKESGNVKIHACSLVCDIMDLKKEDFVDLVDDVVGVGSFIDLAREAKMTLFI